MEQHKYSGPLAADPEPNPWAVPGSNSYPTFGQKIRTQWDEVHMYHQKKDEYDGDHDTVSQYDDMEQHHYSGPPAPDATPNPWAVPGSNSYPSSFAQNRDNYDKDPHSVSEYDAGELHQYMPRPPKDAPEPNPWAVPGSRGIKVPSGLVQK